MYLQHLRKTGSVQTAFLQLLGCKMVEALEKSHGSSLLPIIRGCLQCSGILLLATAFLRSGSAAHCPSRVPVHGDMASMKAVPVTCVLLGLIGPCLCAAHVEGAVAALAAPPMEIYGSTTPFSFQPELDTCDPCWVSSSGQDLVGPGDFSALKSKHYCAILSVLCLPPAQGCFVEQHPC